MVLNRIKRAGLDLTMIFVAFAFIFGSWLIYLALNNPLFSEFEQLLIILIAFIIFGASLTAMFR